MIENDDLPGRGRPGPGRHAVPHRDKRTGAELLRRPAAGDAGQPGGNELLVQEEYDHHPRWGEGPWLLSPKGPGAGSGGGQRQGHRAALPARLPGCSPS